MESLTNNLISNMRGPQFLMLYGAVITFVVICCWAALRFDVTDRGKQVYAPTNALVARLASCTMIIGLGAYKLAIALSRGRPNVGFLILFAIVGVTLVVTMRGRAK